MPDYEWRSSNYLVSFYNYDPKVVETFSSTKPAKVKFHDITLRDGEQQANIIFRKDEKRTDGRRHNLECF